MSNWVSLLDRADQVHPDRTAIAASGETWTFADVARSARAGAAGLADLGVRPGSRVLVVSRNIPEYLILATAVARLGGVLVPVNFRLSVDEVASLAMDCRATVIAADHEFADLGERVADLVPDLALRIRLDAGRPWFGWVGFPSLMDGSAAGSEVHPCAATDLARIMYTSGTTGRAKGVEVTHGMWTFNTMAQVQALDVRSDDRILVTAPMHHVGGFDLPGPGTWLAGAALVLERRFSPAESIGLMRDQGVTGATLVQTMLHRLVAADPESLSGLTLRWLQFGSLPAGLVSTLQRLMPEVALVRGYGMTETLGGMCHNVITKDTTDVVSVGHPMPFMEVRVVDETGQPCPSNVAGDIEVRGPKVTSGYFNNTLATADALRDGWLATGDIGQLDGAGRLTITDRRKDLIRSGSENISSQEVEEVLYRHGSIREAAVVGLPDEQWGEVPVAFVVTSVDVPEHELSQHCRQRLAGFKVPKQFIRVDQLPRNASGKVAKRDLRDGLARR